MLKPCDAQRGLTLIEVLVASGLAFAVAIGISTMEGSRTQMQEELIKRNRDLGDAALATVQISERIAQADWVDLNNGGGVFKFRIPDTDPDGCATAACLDNPASYRWDRYRLVGGTLWLDVGCGAGRPIARNITGLTLTPTAGNEVGYLLRWGVAGPPPRAYEFRGLVASRARSSPPPPPPDGALNPVPPPC